MSVSRHVPRRLTALLAASLILPLMLSVSIPLSAAASPAVASTAPAQEKTATDADQVPDETAVPESQRDTTLGDGWQDKEDIAWTTSGDSAGFHILTARMNEGYQWTQLATLGSEAFDTDRWIGNACLTSDQRWLAVAYAPRNFTNDEALFTRGAFAAFVNIETGEVVPLSGGYSLAYFSPGCGQGDRAAFAQYSDEGASRISTFSAAAPETPAVVEIGQTVTSIIPTEQGLKGVIGRSIVDVDAAGQATTVLEAEGIAFDLSLTADGGLAYMQHDGERAEAMFVASADGSAKSEPVELAAGALGAVGLSRDSSGSVYVTGDPETTTDKAPAVVKLAPGTATRSQPSSTGELILDPTGATTDQDGSAKPQDDLERAAAIEATLLDTSSEITFTVPTLSQPPAGGGFSASTDQQRGVTSESSTSPISSGSICAVPRNDPAIQALQPRPAEVEWAVNQGIRQTLHSSFPLPGLSGGGRVPAQIMLGILAQESNFWQASKYVVPGVTGNPLVGNYYGINRDSSAENAWWQIDYAKADCGYGIAQVTTGMEAGDMPYSQQLAIAVDYKANIARGLQILIEKWNESRAEGLIINDGDPKYLENWFYALWTYNTGFKPNNGGRWGVGWLNNPINDLYAPNRTPFLDGQPSDAAHPQDWPYPEKVLGFAAHSVQFLDSVSSGPLKDTFNYVPAFKPAWWTGSDGQSGVVNRASVKPPIALFCNASNECNPTNTAAPCTRSDYQCWFHSAATWKPDCGNQCGYEFLSYSLGAAKPAGANSFPSNCSTTGLPSGALIVDSVPPGTASIRSGCSTISTTGSFQFDFPSGQSGKYPAKIDVHQLGSGFNGQFYFSHTRVGGTTAAGGGDLLFSGKWSLGQNLDKWAQVYVHMPSHGAWLQQATYNISTGTETVARTVNQRNYANEWVSLGTLKFNGAPSISLSNTGVKYPDDFEDALNGVDDIAWDAVAFVPLANKPSEFIVALGDSYSSGEGTSAAGGYDFFRGSDHNGGVTGNPNRNACHRSPYAWSSQMALPSLGATTVGALSANRDPRVDYQLLACAGAETPQVLPGAAGVGSYLELPQLDRGFLDDNTTIVTLTIGGNDIGFAPVLIKCITASIALAPCAGVATPTGNSDSLADQMPKRLEALPAKVTAVLQAIHVKAKNAKIIVLGYPKLFSGPGACVFMSDTNRVWLNEVADGLNAALTKASSAAGAYAYYANAEYAFEGHTMCESQPGITAIDTTITPGDIPQAFPGTPYAGGASSQSLHPNQYGAWLYANVAMDLNTAVRLPLSAGITGGAATTYYSTFRLHSGGPAAMNVTSFSSCGGELRIGLRKNDASNSGVVGQQHTDSLAWKTTSALKNFKLSTGGSYQLPSGWYALNARLVNACAAGTSQTWGECCNGEHQGMRLLACFGTRHARHGRVWTRRTR